MELPSLSDYESVFVMQPVLSAHKERWYRLVTVKCMVVSLLNNGEHSWAMCTVVKGSRSSSE